MIIKEYVLPEGSIQEVAENNMLMIFKDFVQRKGYSIHIESYTATGNEYMVFEDEDNKHVYNLKTGEYWGCNEWIRKME